MTPVVVEKRKARATKQELNLSSFCLLKFLLLASFSFVFGRSWRLVRKSPHVYLPHQEPEVSLAEHLQSQIGSQAEIQKIIRGIMVCSTRRIIVSAPEQPKDGFASEFQYLARLLQMSVSTNRSLVLTPDWRSAYEPPDCRSLSIPSGWECLWEPMISDGCPVIDVPLESNKAEFSPLGAGILQQQPSSPLFDVSWYGPSTVALAPNSFSRRGDRIGLRADVLPHFERSYGRFWVRSQMAHYLWKPNAMLQAQIKARFPAELGSGKGPPFIGFHVRYTDNRKDFQRHFSRNATVSRRFSLFMAFAVHIRNLYPEMGLHHIYLATDNNQILEQSKQSQWETLGWKFITQSDVQRSKSLDRMWFREGRHRAAAAIATDIEVLRRADFLVSSFQSNVYRLACELNTAWHVSKYPLEMQRHWTVDVEWYEDP